jgi:hypothetical protein
MVQRLGRPPAVADLQGLDQLRDGQPQPSRPARSCSAGHFESRNTNHAQGDYYIVSLDGSPLLATITSPLAGWVDRLNYNLGLYAQDSWTTKRLTLSGGVRLDFQNESVDAYQLRARPVAAEPERQLSGNQERPQLEGREPAAQCRLRSVRQRKDGHQGAASAAASCKTRLALPAPTIRPANALVTSTSRLWFDNNGNQTPDCDLANPAPQNFFGPGFDPTRDLCGPWDNANFGNPALATTWDSKILDGWGVRPYNWEYSWASSRR